VDAVKKWWGVGRGGRSQKNGGVLVEVDAVKKWVLVTVGAGGVQRRPAGHAALLQAASLSHKVPY